MLADAGVAARRACEKLIEEGRVEVNGEVVQTIPAFVDPRKDRITVDGKPIGRPIGEGGRRMYILLNKPERVLTTSADEPGLERTTVADLVDHPSKPRLFPVGRLGWDETGLVLLTNDGELANRLSHPRYGIPKTYLAVVKGDVADQDLQRLGKQMFKLQRLASRREGRARGAHVEMSVFKREPGKTTLKVVMREGKNRFVADVLRSAGFPVRKVAAVAIGPLQLRGLTVGSWRELGRDEVKALRNACRESPAGGTATRRDRPAHATHGEQPTRREQSARREQPMRRERPTGREQPSRGEFRRGPGSTRRPSGRPSRPRRQIP